MANACPVCGGKLGLLNREKSADGLICASCSNFLFSKLGIRAAKQPTDVLAAYWATLEQRRKVFKETDSIYDGDALFVSIDKPNRLFCIGHRSGDKGPRMIYSFDEVAGYDSDTPDDLTVTETKGGIGRAVIGAAVAGPVAAPAAAEGEQEQDDDPPCAIIAKAKAVAAVGVCGLNGHGQNRRIGRKRHFCTPFVCFE